MSLARAVTSRPFGREMDRLLSTGEQVSIALVAMAFMEKGQPAVSMTGAQAGILSSDNHGKGRILTIDPKRVFKALDEGNVVVVAGFQGITDCGDITTLGRGGSDTTAVALAGAMQADVCEIFTDVEGCIRPTLELHRMRLNWMKLRTVKCLKWLAWGGCYAASCRRNGEPLRRADSCTLYIQ